jgi:predicted dithiol-disulfide oxidoreductase (DUF899 family)
MSTTASMFKPKGLLRHHHVLPREESVAFRIDLLAKEKQLTRLRNRSLLSAMLCLTFPR